MTKAEMKPGNIILFPKWQKMLEEESIAAIKEKKFEEALEKLNNLLSYQVKSHEIYTGKLICLMELERYDEAQELCEALIEQKDDHYYQYIHIYLTLLFQTNQYHELMEIVQSELKSGKVPDHLKGPFEQFFTMSKKLHMNKEYERSNLYLEALFDAVHQDDHIEQWRLINKLSSMQIAPSEKLLSLLMEEHVHPINKSAIFIWIKNLGVNRFIDIHKFGIKQKINPNETPSITESSIAKKIYAEIRDVEQSNPSLYQVMETLLTHYLFVLYPITPPLEDAPLIAEALHVIGNDYFNITIPQNGDENVIKYIEEIKTTDLLYASIVDD